MVQLSHELCSEAKSAVIFQDGQGCNVARGYGRAYRLRVAGTLDFSEDIPDNLGLWFGRT